jgi:hypothetical protein
MYVMYVCSGKAAIIERFSKLQQWRNTTERTASCLNSSSVRCVTTYVLVSAHCFGYLTDVDAFYQSYHTCYIRTDIIAIVGGTRPDLAPSLATYKCAIECWLHVRRYSTSFCSKSMLLQHY